MKKILIILSIVSAFFFNTVMAESSTETQTASKKNSAGPMTVFKRTSPMPLLMPVIVKNGEQLGLSDKQSAVFTQWRVENMRTSLKIGNEILAGEQAIRQASLDGKSTVEIEQMMISVMEKRQSIASNMLKCRDMIIKTLDTTQWAKLVTIYNKMNKA